MTTNQEHTADLHKFLESASAELRRFAEQFSMATDISDKLHELARELEILDQKLGKDEADDSA